MSSNSIIKRQIRNINLSDKVVVDLELSDYLDKREGGDVSGTVNIIQHDLNVLSGDIVQTNGSFIAGQSSVAKRNSFAYGTGVSAIGENSYAFGKDSVAGCYGWYYKYLDLPTGTFYLTTEQPNVRNISSMGTEPEIDSSFESGFEVGDVISYVNMAKHEMYATIVEVTGNKIVVGKLNDIVRTIEEEHPNHDDWTIFVPEKPTVGQVWLGECAFAEGLDCKAINAYSYTEGRKNLAYGQYSHAEGYKSRAAYAAHAEGKENYADGQQSHAEGYKTEARGLYSHAEGRETVASGPYSHAEGYNTYATGKQSHASGFKTEAKGENSFTAGENSQALATANNAFVIGRYSRANDTSGRNSFVWQGKYDDTKIYDSNRHGSFNVNPQGGLSGFYIGNNNFIECVLRAVQAMNDTQKSELKSFLGL